MPDGPVRVRFCPSPTGLLHVGGVRTALFNWLYARHVGGTLVLRIEDTDADRENPEAVEQIQRSLRWTGIDWDEGPGVGGPHEPYLQSLRRPRHLELARRLVAEGSAYPCYCTPEQLEAERAAARAADRPAIYSGRCRTLDAAERARFEAEGRRPAIRFAVPREGETVFDDLVRGESRFENALLGDHIVVRSDGVPTYNFVNPIDDLEMGITHVLRGDDLMPSTPRQILLYGALGAEPPAFGHLSLILGPDRKRLSKRHGATSVEELRDAGFLPEAVVNLLALLGWSLDAEREIFTPAELVELFTLERVHAAPAVFDEQKLAWMNGVHLRALTPGELGERLVRYLSDTGSPLAEQPELVRACVPLVQEKIGTLAEFEPYCRFLFGPVEIEPAARERLVSDERAPAILAAAAAALEAVEPFDVERVEQALRGVGESLELKPRVAFTPIRIALTGRTVSPGLFESAAMLGRSEAVARLRAARPAA
jgi:glutamyl-tRNA synthetase